jgi:organic radical activating enzyme
MTLKIAEYFPSIQGEGPEMGRLALFVRLGQCNLSCDFCDSKYAQDNWLEVTIIEVVDYIKRSGLTHIVLTGGEPMLQYNGIVKLTRMLKDLNPNYHVAIETNGSIYNDPSPFDLVVMSPKNTNDIVQWVNHDNVHFKLLIDEGNVDQQLTIAAQLPEDRTNLMPLGTTPDEILYGTHLILSKLVESKLNLSISPRLHVLLGVK